MASISKLLAASEKVQLPEQATHTLPANKIFFLGQAGIAILVCVMTQLSNIDFPSLYIVLISVLAGLYAIASLYCAFTSKVIFDENGISIPGVYPFSRQKVSWEEISRAELTGVITYRYFLEKIIKNIFSSVFANAELHVTYLNVPGGAKSNFPVLDRVSSKATAIRIIREKLGDRFTIYQGEY